jgi:hypothetical protein
VSLDDPADRVGDRPRMAEALASLKEGLRESADPLYDGWKRKPGSGVAPGQEGVASIQGVHRPPLATDTVRVRVIRYQVFPKWALISAASLIVFSASVAALRFGLPSSAWWWSSRRAPDPVRVLPAVTSDLAVTADRAVVVAAEPASPFASDQAATASPERRSTPPRTAPVAPVVKTPPPSTRRRAPHDTGFFREPGF